MHSRPMKWLMSLGWMAVGALGTLGIYGLLTVGVFLLGAAAALCAPLARSRRSGNEVAGLLAAGGGAALLVLGVLALPYTPCGPEGLTATTENPIAECGGWNPLIYFIPAGAMIVGALAAALSPQQRTLDATFL